MAVVITYNNKLIDFDNVPYVQPGISFDGLKLYLDANNPLSYPRSGNVWYDLSETKSNGTLLTPTYNVSGGGSFYFSPSRTDVVDCGSEITKLNLQALTITMWIKPTDTTGADNFLIQLDAVDGSPVYYGVTMLINGYSNGQYTLVSDVGDGVWAGSTNRRSVYTNNRVITKDTWQMVTVVYSTAQSVKLYVNKTQITELNYGGSYFGTNIGCSFGAGKTLLADRWGGIRNSSLLGYMNDVIIYSRALTQQEIIDIYNIKSFKYL